jgi:hypothetical protein
MKQMALRSRLAVLVVAALLSVTGASVTAAAVADEAHAHAVGVGSLLGPN